MKRIFNLRFNRTIIIISIIVLAALIFTLTTGCSFRVTDKASALPGNAETDKSSDTNTQKSNKGEDNMDDEKLINTNDLPDTVETAVLGGGCFWCLEALFVRLKGVITVESGYAGGSVENPTYQQVCSGNTGHAEVIKITYDPGAITYRQLLEVFFYTHDPTTLNRQGNDVGTQYRSIILYNSAEQEKTANVLVAELGEQKFFKDPIVTEIKPLKIFYKAEDYHQSYYEENPAQPYCQIVILPKLEKFEDKFADLLKVNQ